MNIAINEVFKEALHDGVLNVEFHERLLADLDRVVEIAGIPASFVGAKLSDYCKGKDYEWVKGVKDTGTYGLCYVGKQDPLVEDKMMAIAGTLLRNYIDARVMSLQTVFALLRDGALPTPTVLLIPNFCVHKGDGGTVAPWQIPLLLGLLIDRMGKGLKTVVGVASMSGLEESYGSLIAEHIKKHFDMV